MDPHRVKPYFPHFLDAMKIEKLKCWFQSLATDNRGIQSQDTVLQLIIVICLFDFSFFRIDKSTLGFPMVLIQKLKLQNYQQSGKGVNEINLYMRYHKSVRRQSLNGVHIALGQSVHWNTFLFMKISFCEKEILCPQV